VNTLGLDTSTPASAVCVLREDGRTFESVPAPERLTAPPAHARELLPSISACLDQAELSWRELDSIAVGVGPGMFTGLRIGVTTARALAAGLGVELRPVSSLAALAANAAEDMAANGSGPVRPTLTLIDARRGEVFTALHEEGHIAWQAYAAAPEAVAARVQEAGIAALAVGDGAVRFRDVLGTAGISVPPDDSALHVVRGLWICRLAAMAAPVAVEAVLPDYIRLPDAQPRTP
jgi:tRNA threonylcarbamoyladenosine biosynthesis protein TsaB